MALLLVLVLSATLAYSLYSGRAALWRFSKHPADKRTSPTLYWLAIGVNVIGIALSLYFALFHYINSIPKFAI
jgi:hypothetical protein